MWTHVEVLAHNSLAGAGDVRRALQNVSPAFVAWHRAQVRSCLNTP
jgi:hypothetical protein